MILFEKNMSECAKFSQNPAVSGSVRFIGILHLASTFVALQMVYRMIAIMLPIYVLYYHNGILFKKETVLCIEMC